MHRPTLYIGLLVILAMCLVPPFETGAVDKVGDVLRGETVQQVEYRPLWNRPELREDDVLAEVHGWNIAGGRLLLQVLGVAVVTTVVAYLRGS